MQCKVFRISLVAALCGLMVTGCINPCYRAAPLNIEGTDLGRHVAAALDEGTVALEESTGNWWEFFEDAQLSYWIEIGLKNHPDIQVAEARIERASWEAQKLRAQMLPHFFFSADFAREKQSLATWFGSNFISLFTQTTLQIATTTFELDIWKKNRALYYAQLDEVQAQMADWQEARLVLSTAIARAYFLWQTHRQLLEIYQKRLEAREALFALLKQSFTAGVLSQFRVYETDSEVQIIRDTLYQMEAAVEVDQHALAALVGNPVQWGEEAWMCPPQATYTHPFPLPSALPVGLLIRRPDVRAQLWRVEGAGFLVHAARARFYPALDLTTLLGVQSIQWSQLFTDKALIVLGEATGVLPLFTAGSLSGDLMMAAEQWEIEVGQYNGVVLTAVQQVSDALTSLHSADKRLKALQINLQDAETLVRLSEDRFHRGVDSKVATLNAWENFYVQKNLEVGAQQARFLAAVDLIRSLGGGYSDYTQL